MLELKLEFREIIRPAHGNPGADPKHAIEAAGIPLEKLACVRFIGSENGLPITLDVFVDATGKTSLDAIGEARRRVEAKRIGIG